MFEVKRVVVGQDHTVEGMLRRAARPRPLSCSRAYRSREDARGPDARGGDRGHVLAAAVHSGPGARRHRRNPDRAAVDEGFDTELGPVFANLVLADEINRAPAKVQSALLEAMAEHQVSIGGTSYPLPDPFLVLATQNPIESDGVYALPEAQRDRFLLKITVDYPTPLEELTILQRMSAHRPHATRVLDA